VRVSGILLKEPPPRWVRILVDGRSILSLFLIGLMLLLSIGGAGALQNALAPFGAGQTGLSYSVASFRNESSLVPMLGEGRFSLSSTPDAELQRYFSIDSEQGTLSLRDGLKSINPTMNPLNSFPLQIIEVPDPPVNQNGHAKRLLLRSLYVTIVSCDQFLADQQAAEDQIHRVIQCAQIQPLQSRWVTRDQVKSSIQRRGASLFPPLIESHLNAYMEDAEGLLNIPKQNAKSYAWATGDWSGKILEISILRGRANPGLEIFSPENENRYTKDAEKSSPPFWLDKLTHLMLQLDTFFLLVLKLRYPILIGIGILLPLLMLALRWRDSVVRRFLSPYLLLLFAQVVTMLVADALMGEGLLLWVGFAYTLLRLVQLKGLLWMGGSQNPSLRRRFDLKSRPFLHFLLYVEFFLWGINAIGLAWHFVWVVLNFSAISPA
jgi:hypothetical protein